MASKENGKKADATANIPSSSDTTPKRQVRHRKVFATKKVNKNLDKIYRENASDSPLLRLPPEIRNRIWMMVLGGRTLRCRVDYYNNGSVQILREICPDDWARCEDLTARMKFDRAGVRHQRAQDAAASYVTNRVSFNLLLTCREIHAEAALIPYKHNIFLIESTSDMPTILKAMVPAQAGAIENIAIGPHFSCTMFKRDKDLLRTKLKGVRHLTLRVFLVMITVRYAIENAETQLEESMPLWQGLPLQTANVIVNVDKKATVYEPSIEVNEKALADFKGKMEQRLLIRPSKMSINAVTARQLEKRCIL